MSIRPPCLIVAAVLLAAGLLPATGAVGQVAASAPPALQRLVLLTEEFPPYNFSEYGIVRGSSVDLLRAMLTRAGAPQIGSTIQVMPWARAYRRVLAEPNTALFAMTRTAEREDKFAWVGPISKARNVLIARADSGIRLKNVGDAITLRIGVIYDDAAGQLLERRGIPAARLDAAPDAVANVRKLAAGRIDLFAYDENVFFWTVRQLKLDPKDFVVVLPIEEGEHYFGFNKQTDPAVISLLQRTLDQLKADGTYQRIMDAYLR